MAFSISEFKATLANSKFGGLAQANKFAIVMNAPPAVAGKFSPSLSNQDLSFFCDTTSLPGKNLNTFDYKPQGYGDVVKIPVSRPAQTLNTTFFVDSNYQVVKYFHGWLEYILEGTANAPNQTLDNFRSHRELGYKKNYCTQIELYGYQDNGAKAIKYTLHKAFPVQVGDVGVGWEQNDTLVKLPVEFSYEFWTSELIAVANPTGFTPSGISLFSSIASLASIVGVISTIKKPRNIQDIINLGTTVNTILKVL